MTANAVSCAIMGSVLSISDSETQFAGVLTRLQTASPGFDYDYVLHRGNTCLLIAGTRYGQPVVAKVLHDPAPHWRDQFAREIQAYRLFAQVPPPIAVPELVEADERRAVLVLSRVAAQPVALIRHPQLLPDKAVLAGALTQLRKLATWHPELPETWRVNYQTRLDRVLRQGIFTSADHTAVMMLMKQIAHSYSWEFAHGDLELTNLLHPDQGFTFVDWGSAGLYLPGFDLALWWVILGDLHGPRRVIDDLVSEAGPVLQAPFLINLALLAARELRTYQNMRPGPVRDARIARLTEDWNQVRDRLHEVS